MSLKMHKNITLGGYNAQVFPPISLRLLHNLQRRKINTNLMFLNKVGEVIDEHLSTDRIEKQATTSDDYYWYATMLFRVQSGHVAILFPWSQDWKKRNRSQDDRSIAIFADKSVLFEDIDKLV